jgi:uncharacterized phosphatase
MLIYVVRHGQSTDDLSDSYGGAADFPLTDHGREQARLAAARLRGSDAAVIYSSPLARAAQSAEIIASELGGLPVEVVSDLRERNAFGVLSGHTRARAQELFGYLLEPVTAGPDGGQACLPGSEEYDRFACRVRGAFGEVVRRAVASAHETIAIVTHRQVTLALFTSVLGLGDNYEQGHGAVNAIVYQRPRFVHDSAPG